MTLTIDVASAGKFIIILVFGIVTIAIISLVIGNIRRFFASRKFDAHDLEGMRRRWQEIENTATRGGELDRKMAVLEADKLLDTALKALAMPGTTLGERLKFAQYKYPDLRDVWGAHRVRNQLAHEAGFRLDAGTARRALNGFQKALKRLGAI